jgi:dihydroxyacetone kinase-like protein
MSDLNIDAPRIIAILEQVSGDLKSHAEELRELDAQLGDGDLGITVELASQAITDYLKTTGETDIGKILAQCAMNINQASPSTFGTILSSAFMGGAKAAMGKTQLGLEDFTAIGEGAVENIMKRGKANTGDKTVLDSLVPAVEALKKEIATGAIEREAISAAVKAAEDGMKATVNMKAKFGRAQWFKDGSAGIQDGGATAMYYLIKSFADCLLNA